MSDVVPDVIPFSKCKSKCKCDIPIRGCELRERLRVPEKVALMSFCSHLLADERIVISGLRIRENRMVRQIAAVIGCSASVARRELRCYL